MVTYPCPHCGERLTAPDERTGRQIFCGLCGKSSIVPGQLPRAEAPVPEDLTQLPQRGLDDRISVLRRAKSQRKLTEDEAARLDRLYQERSRRHLAKAEELQRRPKPLVLDGCEHGQVARIMEVGEAYSAHCQRKMKLYDNVQACLADCSGTKGRGVNPKGEPCHCIIEPASKYSVFGDDNDPPKPLASPLAKAIAKWLFRE